MKKKDHLQIGKLLLAQKDTKLSGIQRLAFLFGCVEPDINPFTYARGSIKHEFLHGHHADNSSKHRHKLMHRLSNSGVHSLWQWFSLGTLIHYAVDSFTYPHNSVFGGSMAEHIQYEKQLHANFVEHLKELAARGEQKLRGIRDVDALHERYLKGAGTVQTDCRYIIDSSKLIWSHLLSCSHHHLSA